MAENVSRRGLLLRLTSRDVLVDAARGVAPVWREVVGLTRPAEQSVDAAVAALRQRKCGAAAGVGASAKPQTPAGGVAAATAPSTARAATERP
jgi:hypothetical protein